MRERQIETETGMVRKTGGGERDRERERDGEREREGKQREKAKEKKIETMARRARERLTGMERVGVISLLVG